MKKPDILEMDDREDVLNSRGEFRNYRSDTFDRLMAEWNSMNNETDDKPTTELKELNIETEKKLTEVLEKMEKE